MKDRIYDANEGIIFMVIDWDILVNVPKKGGFLIEAFASADALIDSEIESI